MLRYVVRPCAAGVKNLSFLCAALCPTVDNDFSSLARSFFLQPRRVEGQKGMKATTKLSFAFLRNFFLFAMKRDLRGKKRVKSSFQECSEQNNSKERGKNKKRTASETGKKARSPSLGRGR